MRRHIEQMEKMPFSEKPLSVYTGVFEVTTSFQVSPTAAVGPAAVSGKLRYQACNDRACFAAKSIDIAISYQVQ